MIIYKRSDKVNEKFILDVLKLDSKAYPKELQGSFKTVNARFQKNRQSYILAYDGTKLIGYLCFLNISQKLKEKILNNPIYNDDLISSSDVLPFSVEKTNTIYFISMVVEQQYRNKGIATTLIGKFKSFINELTLSGYKFDSILADAVTDEGYKILVANNFDTIKVHKNNAHLVFYKFDDYKNTNVYAFIPCKINDHSIISKFGVTSLYSKKVNEVSNAELNENVTISITRHDAPVRKIIIYNDTHTKKIADLKADISIAKFKNVCCLTMIFQNIGIDPTYLLECFSTVSFKFGAYPSLKEYLSSLGLEKCGEIKTFTSLMQKPNPTHMLYMLAGEEYVRGLMGSTSIVSKHFQKFAESNIAQYNFSDIYASEKGVIYILDKKYANEHLLYDIYMTFIIERSILQLASIMMCNNKLLDLLDQQDFTSQKASYFVKEFSQYSYLWGTDLFKYSVSNHLFSKLEKRFGFIKLKEMYYENLNTYEKLSSLVSGRARDKLSKQSKTYFAIFTALSSFGTLNTIIGLIFAIVDSVNMQAIVALSIGAACLLAFIVIYIFSLFKMKKNND